MTDTKDHVSNDPLHGVTLKAILETLVFRYGWPGLGERIRLNCFLNDPSIKSSLKFLRKTPWARTKVESLYLKDLRAAERHRKRSAPALPAITAPVEVPGEASETSAD